MKHILIYTLKIDSNLIVQKLSQEYEIAVCHSFADAMESIAQKVPHLIISDYQALRQDQNIFHYALHNDFIMIDIPVIAIGCLENDNMEQLSIRQKLYTFNIKRYLYIHSEVDLQKTVERELNKWNPHLGSYTHRFVKSFLLFADSKKYEQRMRIFLTYIMSHYELSNEASSDIKFASAILSTTFTTQNYQSVLEFYTNMRFAKPILRLLRSVYAPTNLEEEILSSVFLLETHLNSPDRSLNSLPELPGIRPDVIGYLREAYLEKRYFLQSYKDIIPFWEELSNLLLKSPLFGDEEISLYLENIQECMMLVLVESQRAYMKIIEESQKVTVLITPLDSHVDTLRCSGEQYNNALADITYHSDENGSHAITLTRKSSPIQPQVQSREEPDAPVSAEEKLLHDAHGTSRYSAAEYIRDLGGLPNVIDELHLIDEILMEILTLLNGKVDLSHGSTQKDIIKSIREFRTVLQNNFYEFQAIALTLLKIENLLGEITNHPEISIDKLRLLLLSVFDDIGAWKTTVFDEQTVADINYLDSSILSSSFQIEALFFPPEESEDEECEFF